jgi:hypothetical protein
MTRAQNSIAEVWYTRDAHSYFVGFLYKLCSVMSSSDHFAFERSLAAGARRVVRRIRNLFSCQ